MKDDTVPEQLTTPTAGTEILECVFVDAYNVFLLAILYSVFMMDTHLSKLDNSYLSGKDVESKPCIEAFCVW